MAKRYHLKGSGQLVRLLKSDPGDILKMYLSVGHHNFNGCGLGLA